MIVPPIKLRQVTLLLMMTAMLLTACQRAPQFQVIPAIGQGDLAKVTQLLDDTENVNVNWRAGGEGDTALIVAAGRNELPIVKLLLSRGAEVNLATADGFTALFMAGSAGNTEVVRVLLAAGADPNRSEIRYGYTPLARAIERDHEAIVQLLLDAGADPDSRLHNGKTIEELALEKNNPVILRGVRMHGKGSAPASQL
jgi:ankyrin repeat protein